MKAMIWKIQRHFKICGTGHNMESVIGCVAQLSQCHKAKKNGMTAKHSVIRGLARLIGGSWGSAKICTNFYFSESNPPKDIIYYYIIIVMTVMTVVIISIYGDFTVTSLSQAAQGLPPLVQSS